MWSTSTLDRIDSVRCCWQRRAGRRGSRWSSSQEMTMAVSRGGESSSTTVSSFTRATEIRSLASSSGWRDEGRRCHGRHPYENGENPPLIGPRPRSAGVRGCVCVPAIGRDSPRSSPTSPNRASAHECDLGPRRLGSSVVTFWRRRSGTSFGMKPSAWP
jgi:hypothetical protein